MGNPAQYIKYSVPSDEKRDALQPAQVKELLQAAESTKAELMVHLALYCGLRRGEIMGLMWSDIREGILHVARAAQVVHNKAILKGTKSNAGIRSIPIPQHLQDMLAAAPRTSAYIVPAASVEIISKTGFNKRWMPVQKQLSFPMVFHQLRHTNATNLHKLGFDPKTKQYLMGHAQLDMTLGTYTDIQEEQLQAASKKLGKIYSISQKSVKTA